MTGTIHHVGAYERSGSSGAYSNRAFMPPASPQGKTVRRPDRAGLINGTTIQYFAVLKASTHVQRKVQGR
ncbi:hypothetical protein GQ55_2G119700 [Panicum hallii var. hallii]|uniref:Uncharacterized protein n=1 Tax=Panicum hallii var. hallii TaxID=1504633 RepID=A0A2T7EP09_9POAL|nr:hypothetical protein GQ55_2G119700 [Panicum hallii var. hallii]